MVDGRFVHRKVISGLDPVEWHRGTFSTYSLGHMFHTFFVRVPTVDYGLLEKPTRMESWTGKLWKTINQSK